MHYARQIIVLFVIGVFAATAFPMDWPGYHGPNRDRISSESGWLTEWTDEGPAILWRKRLGVGYGSIAAVGDRVYVMGYDKSASQDVVYCFDAATGEEIWRHAYDCAIYDNLHQGGPTSTPEVHEGRVYTISKEAHFHCLNAETGEAIWVKDLREELNAEVPTWGFSGSPLIDGENVIVDVGYIAAFDKQTGELVWKTDENHGSAYASPIAFEWNGERLIAAFPAYGLVIVQAEDGAFVTKRPWETSYGVNAATPIVYDDSIFISSGYNRGCAKLRLREGTSPETVWENRLMRNQMNASVLFEGHLYGFDESQLVCLAFETGEEKWRQDGLGKGSLMIADGYLIVLGERGELVIAPASAESFDPSGRMHILGGTNWTCPVLSNGRLFARNAQGDMAALDMSSN